MGDGRFTPILKWPKNIVPEYKCGNNIVASSAFVKKGEYIVTAILAILNCETYGYVNVP